MDYDSKTGHFAAKKKNHITVLKLLLSHCKLIGKTSFWVPVHLVTLS